MNRAPAAGPPAVDASRQPVAFVTMVRGDPLMLSRWIDHHAALAGGRQALHIVAHGPDPRIAELAAGCSLVVLPYDPTGRDFEPRRVRLFFGMVEALLGYYRHVVTLDTDELLLPDADIGGTVGDYLDSVGFEGVALAPVGFDLTHRPSVEPEPLDWSRPLTAQRRHGFLHVAYSKPCIFRARPPRGGNQHRLYHQPWQIDPALLLVHMRYADRDHAAGVGADRMRTVAAFDAAGSTHRIGTWADRDRRLPAAIAAIEAAPCPPLSFLHRHDFAERQMQLYRDRSGTLLWKGGQSPGYRLGDDWAGRV